jgi:glucose-6-phosphate 1-dehydrogenase
MSLADIIMTRNLLTLALSIHPLTRTQKKLLVLVVGASGDLAKKKTYPALLELWKAHLLPAKVSIWGFARTVKTHEELRQHLRPHLLASSLQKQKNNMQSDSNDGIVAADDGRQEALVDDFLSICFYRAGKSYGDTDVVDSIFRDPTNTPIHNLLVYLAVPPHVFSETTAAIRYSMQQMTDTPITGFTRIVLEKPFGNDTASCQVLLDALHQQKWSESNLFRIDHYLGKEMVQNILSMRQNNPWLRALWCKEVVQSVHILFKEPFGTDGRGGYFDPYGMIRDVLQNHLLQILSLVAMEMPITDETGGASSKSKSEDIRNAKVDVLKNIPAIQLQDCLLGQYDGYKNDPSIENRETVTPTYAAVKLDVNTPTWEGVPFVLEAGKALDERLCEIRLHFKGSTESQPNALVMRLQPNPALYFCANLKKPGFSETPVSTHLGVDYAGAANKIPDAYTRLLLDVLRGHQASFVRDDELLAAWKIFTPVLHQTERECVQPLPYQMGTSGPESRAKYLETVGVTQAWLPPASAL